MQQSTETALHNVANDFLIASEERLVSGLVLLDLSAFLTLLTITSLLKRLEHVIGIKQTALSWYRFYLSD